MDRMLYVAMSGAKQTLVAQAINSHNLANATTTGFKADLNQLRSMPVFGTGHPSRVYAMTERPGPDLSAGAIQETGRELDVALSGEGWIAVQAPDGGEAYTRRGDLHLTVNGILETGAGHPVLGNGGAIAIPQAEKLDIGSDGTVSIRPLGQDAKGLAEIDRIKLVRPPISDLTKGADGLFRLKGGGVAVADAAVTVTRGVLEASNVSIAQALVEMITLARRFEMQVKTMDTVKENDEAMAGLMRLT